MEVHSMLSFWIRFMIFFLSVCLSRVSGNNAGIWPLPHISEDTEQYVLTNISLLTFHSRFIGSKMGSRFQREMSTAKCGVKEMEPAPYTSNPPTVMMTATTPSWRPTPRLVAGFLDLRRSDWCHCEWDLDKCWGACPNCPNRTQGQIETGLLLVALVRRHSQNLSSMREALGLILTHLIKRCKHGGELGKQRWGGSAQGRDVLSLKTENKSKGKQRAGEMAQ